MNVAIVDYGVGNIKSIQHSLDRIGVNHTYTKDKEEIISAEKVVFLVLEMLLLLYETIKESKFR